MTLLELASKIGPASAPSDAHEMTQKPLKINGFTIVEAMVVAAIVGILSTFMMVSYGRNLQEERLKSVSREITSIFKEVTTLTRQKSTHCELILNHLSAVLTVLNPSECTGISTSIDLKANTDNIEDLKICGRTDMDQTFACDAASDGSNPPGSTSSTFIFSARGTVSQGGILKLFLPKARRTRCLAVLAPIGVIREGHDTGSGCDFNINRTS